jgi:hypothetical protein
MAPTVTVLAPMLRKAGSRRRRCTCNDRGTIRGVRVTIACLATCAISAALATQAPPISAISRGEEATLVRLLDDATGRRRSSDSWLHWEPHFLKGARGRTYVPFTVRLDDAGESFRNVAVGVRVIGITLRSGWNDEFGIETTASGDGRVFRASFLVNPGLYRIIVAVLDRDTPRRGVHSAVVEQRVEIPDLAKKGLHISSVVLADRIDDLPQTISDRDRAAYPYAFGAKIVVPARPGPFRRDDRLTVMFQIYNPAMFEDGKPDVEVHYEVLRDGMEDKPVGSTAAQLFNQESLPEEFSLKEGFQLVPIQVLPLSQFEPGAYKLRVEVQDVLGNARVRADVPFTVQP